MNPVFRSILLGAFVFVGLLGCAPKPVAPPEDGGNAGTATNPLKSLGRQPHTNIPQRPHMPWQLVVHLYVLPRDKDLTAATAGLDDAEIGPAKQLMWAYNGFRLGMVPTGGLALFQPLLGRPLETNAFTLHNATTYQYIPLSNRAVTVDLATSDSIAQQAMENRRFAHGRFRMLFRTDLPRDVADLDKPTYTILPQYYRPKLSAIVRTPMEKMLDGTLFNDLALTIPLRADRSLVLYAKLPRLPKKSKPEADAAKATPPKDPDASGLGVPPARPIQRARTMRLAEAMLSGEYKKTKRPVQVVLIIRAVPTPKPKPKPAETRRGNDR